MTVQSSSKRPNVLLIVTDQEQSWSTLPAGLKLPAHERLREAGVSFNRFHVNCSPCAPSRSNLYTGHHTQRTHMHVNPDNPPEPQLPRDLPTLGHLFRQAGYYTAYKGKWHLSHINKGHNFFPTNAERYPDASDALEAYGFSDYNFYGETLGYAWDGYRHDGTIAGDASRLLFELSQGNKTQGAPWLLAVNFVNPHDIMFFDATGRQNETRSMKNFISPLIGAPGDPLYREDLGFDLPASFYAEQQDTKPEIQSFIKHRQSLFYGDLPLSDTENWRTFRNYYFNCIRDVDRHMMTLLDSLQQSGQADRTIVVLTSDHGERAGAHGMQQKAGTVYEEEVAVPAVFVHPDVTGATESNALGSMVDMVPTIFGLCGLDLPALDHPLPGVDLSSAVANRSVRTNRDQTGSLLNYTGTFHWQRIEAPEPGAKPAFDLSRRRLFRGVIKDNYKFCRYFAPAEHHLPVDWQTLIAHNDLELYDLNADPDELNNLAAQPEDCRAQLESLNDACNALVQSEVGVDDGRDYAGPVSQYNTL